MAPVKVGRSARGRYRRRSPFTARWCRQPAPCRRSQCRLRAGCAAFSSANPDNFRGAISCLDIEPSPDAKLQVDLARNEFESAQKAFEFMQQRFDLKLATNDQLLQRKQALEQAREKLESMGRRALDGTRAIHAGVEKLISKVGVQEGAIVPAGNTMIEMVAENRLEVRMGIEPENIDKVKPGQAVSLARVNAPAAGDCFRPDP